MKGKLLFWVDVNVLTILIDFCYKIVAKIDYENYNLLQILMRYLRFQIFFLNAFLKFQLPYQHVSCIFQYYQENQ